MKNITFQKRFASIFLLLAILAPAAIIWFNAGVLATPLTGPITGPNPTVTPTPTIKPPVTAPVTPTPTRVPTITPTIKPNTPPQIAAQKIYTFSATKGFAFMIKITDKENELIKTTLNARFPSSIVGRCPSGQNSNPICTFSGFKAPRGLYPFVIEAIDARGAKTVSRSAIFITR